MRAVAGFIVRFHKAVLAVFLVLTVAAACALPFVSINKDMTVYMPSTMQSKQGTSTMEDEFGASSQFTMMINGLDAQQRKDIVADLEKVQGVTSVEYESEGDNYAQHNRGDSALYFVACTGGTYSDEALGTYAALQEFGDQRGLDYYLDSEVIDGIMVDITGICIFAVILILFILFVMAGSWIEPFLLLGTIGIAVVLNMGSNVFLPSVSDMTFTIAAILQLVLSMDYSIMLMHRFRIERKVASGDAEAMEEAIVSGSRAILSSSLTTVVGLLCLLLMSFTIGRDMGFVLAKGVILSLVCTLTVMPSLILLLSKQLDRTVKKPFAPTMRLFADLCYKAKLPIFCGFLALIAIGFVLKGFGSAAFFLTSYNEDHYVIEETFPSGSQIVVLYDAKDAEKIAPVAMDLESTESVRSVRAYGNTLGKPLTAAEMADALDMDETFVRLLYYDYFAGGQVPDLTMNAFARFLQSDVLGNEDFANQLKGVDASQIDLLARLSDPAAIQKKRTAADMASFLGSSAGMTSKQMKQLYTYYFMEKGVKPGTMTLPAFVSFLNEDVAKDKELSKFLDSDSKAQLKTLAKYANAANVAKQRGSDDMADYLGMNSSDAAMLYRLYAVKRGISNGGAMTADQFIDFILDDVANNPQSGVNIDEKTKEALRKAKDLIPKEELNKPYTADQVYGVVEDAVKRLADMGIGDGKVPFEKSEIDAVFQYRWILHGDSSGIAMNAQTFLAFLLDEVAADPDYASMFDSESLDGLKQLRKIVDVTAAGTKFIPKGMADFLGMKTSDVKKLYQYYQVTKNIDKLTVSAYDLVSFLVSKKDDKQISSNMKASDLAGLATLKKIMSDAIAGRAYSPSSLASTLSAFGGKVAMNASDLELVYLLYASKHCYDEKWAICIYDFVEHLAKNVLNDERFSSFIDDKSKQDLLDAWQTLQDAKAKLLGDNWGMMVVKSDYGIDSNEVMGFMGQMELMLSEALSGDHFLVGKAPMILDMGADFLGELNFISLITALAIFLIVAITFRSLVIPLVLVLLINTAFNLTMGLSGIFSGSTYYVALIIVQAILMGATIDYAILFTTNYRTARLVYGIRESLGIAYRQSIGTILTSGSILVSATFIVGLAQLGTATGQICLTISEGSAFAILLVTFILPGTIAMLDRFMAGKNAVRN